MGKRPGEDSVPQKSKKPAPAGDSMIFAWSQKATAEQEATAAAKKAEEATAAAEAARAKAAEAAAAAAAAASTAAKKTSVTSTALVKAPAFPKLGDPKVSVPLCVHWQCVAKKYYANKHTH